ncbi:MAG: hypothetical protein IKZ60_06885 [Bacteroidales bacterium]|nr:hypothetical protein [Bacteroidales bacterium]
MKKNIYAILAIAALVCACNTKENYTPEEVDGIPFVATVQTDAYTRAVAESGGDITVNFAESETIALVYEVSSTPYKTDATITSVDGSGKATITATLQTGVTDGTAVTLIYPASAADGTTGNVLASALSAQDGTLSAARDVRKGTGTIKVDGTASLASGATLEAQYAICKFEVEDVDGSNSVYVSSFVVKDASDNVITTVTPGSATSTLYVALPATSGLIWFEAVASDKPYVAKGTASLTAGNFYTPTVKMATIFNVIGQNGKFYKDKAAAKAASTLASAIIASLGEDTAEAGYPHGLAIGMGVSNGMTRKWKNEGTASHSQYSSYSLALAAKESGSALCAGKNNADNYPAFYAALNNSVSAADGITSSKPSSGTSNWFLPSAYQMNLIIKGLRGTSANLTNMDQSVLRGTDILYTIQAVGYYSSAPWSSTGNYVWTSTEKSDDEAWSYASSGSLEGKNKTGGAYVLATLAF